VPAPRLGDERLFGDWTAYLRREAAERTWRELLLRWWPRLLPGLAASATHGVIRTAHAVRSLRAAGHRPDPLLVDELAQGLAFWAARYEPLPGDPGLAGALAAVPAIAGLPRLDPAELSGRAVEHSDEHVIKLTEAALREHSRTGDATLLVAADRFRNRLDAAD
jgi:hypothetical protein